VFSHRDALLKNLYCNKLNATEAVVADQFVFFPITFKEDSRNRSYEMPLSVLQEDMIYVQMDM
jgi:hypothetical protein